MQYVFLTIFALFWSALVLGFDGVIARDMFKQFESRHYAVTTGKVTHSEVKSERGSKGGITYQAVVNYQFELGGRMHAGTRLRYNKVSSNRADASNIVAARPTGAAVEVFYNPDNPQDSLLFPGIEGPDLVGILFLTPFNAVMLGFWLTIGGWLRQRLFRPAAGGVKIITDRGCTRARLPQFGPAVWGLAITGGLGFIAVFIVGFSSRMQPSFGLIVPAIGVVYLTGAGVYLWQWQKIRSGAVDLVINHAARTLELPQTYGRKQRMVVSTSDIASLTVERLAHTSSKGGTSYTYAPTLYLRGQNANDQKLADWSNKVRADNFADWLRNQLGR